MSENKSEECELFMAFLELKEKALRSQNVVSEKIPAMAYPTLDEEDIARVAKRVGGDVVFEDNAFYAHF